MHNTARTMPDSRHRIHRKENHDCVASGKSAIEPEYPKDAAVRPSPPLDQASEMCRFKW